MRKIKAIITVRTSSTRLPKKCLLQFGDNTIIQHVISRCLKNNIDPIICTTTDPEDDILCEISRNNQIKFFRGSNINKILRWHNCAISNNLEDFVTIDADDPFFCPQEVKRSYELLLKGNYDLVLPYKSSSNGSAMVGYSMKTNLLGKALKKIDINCDTEMAWTYLKAVKGVEFIELSSPKEFEIMGRLTLDYWEDYIFLEALRLILGNKYSRRDIFNVLKENPGIRKINSFRNKEWAENQLKKSYQNS
tara:strand:+ start:79 stop:825 length:747 start_codon:yes stop_codon:yes gene_type:complete